MLSNITTQEVKQNNKQISKKNTASDSAVRTVNIKDVANTLAGKDNSSVSNKVTNSENSKTDSQGNLTKAEVDRLKNKTITEDGMKFHGLQVVNLGVHMPTDSFAVAPGFNPNGFASSVNEDLYNYLLNPANDQAAMNEATELHGGNPVDTCVFFQSSALRAIGQNVPYSIGYTTHLENWMRNNGWTRHTDFQYIQRGDICFASIYHTFCFMGWKDKAKGIAYVMGNESFTEPYYRNRNLNGQSPAIYGNNSYYQATCYWTYGPGYTGQIQGINPVHGGGYNAIGTATSTATLNIQSSPTVSSSVIGEVPNGVTVPVMTTDGVWYKIYYNGVTGWIDGNYTNGLDESLGNGSAPTNMPVGDNLTVTSPVGLWLTDGPSASSGNIVLLPNGTPVEALAFKDGWYKVNYEGTIGWLDAQYTSANGKDILTGNQQQNQNQPQTNSYTTKAVNGSVTILSDGLCLNKNPFPNDGTETVIPKGVTLKTSLESSNGWYKVTYKGQTGWIGGTPYSKFTPAPVQQNITSKPINATVEVLADGLCLNEHPYPNDGIITVLKKGTKVHAIAVSSNGWYKVTYNGKTGWIGGSPYSKIISSQPLSTNQPQTSQPIKPHSTNQPQTSQPINPQNNQTKPQTTNQHQKVLGRVEVVTGGLCMNEHPSPNDGVITVLRHGTIVPYYKVSSNGWYYVSYNGKMGWIGGSPYSKVVTNQPQPSQPQHIPTNHTPRTKQSTGTITVNSPIGLWMNKGPNTSSAGITVIPYNTKLNYVAEQNGWYEVNYNGQTGWVDGEYVNIDNSSQQSQSMNTDVVVNSPVGLWMNNGPSVSSSQIVVIPYGTELVATAEQNGWYKVSYNGQTGWIDGAYTNQTQTGVVNSPVGLNMRSSAGLGSPVITLIPYNTTVQILSSENGWDEVSYNGQIGWVYGSYITMN